MKDNVEILYKQNFELRKQNASLKKENAELKQENAELKEEINRVSNKLSFANNKIKQLEAKIEKMNAEQEALIERIVNKAVSEVTKKLNEEHKKEIDKLNAKISHYEKILNLDSTNSGIPTSKNRIGKHIIQNNREKSENAKGGQLGHEAHKLKPFDEEEITNVVEHTLDKCPDCGGTLKEKNIVTSDIIDIEIIVTKTRNLIHNYECTKCHKRVSANKDLPRNPSYGSNINALITSLINEANTPLNKVSSVISGITNEEVKISEGYLAKHQKKVAENLKPFINDLKKQVVTLKHLFWDDTTVKTGLEEPSEGFGEEELKELEKVNDENKKYKNGVIRFYGDDSWAYLVGHRKKNSDSVDDDGILDCLSSDCVVMHDHLLLNYNDKYNFKNAECNEHIRRYLKGNMDKFPNHKWAGEMRKFITNLNTERKAIIENENQENVFSNQRLIEISNEYDRIIKLGYEENKTVDLTYIENKNDELKLINRLNKYKENHLMFVTDFSVAFTNNTSEKGLRQTKRKLAVSFMFKNANRMKDYATILSYLETCFRHGISRYNASKRLAEGNPYTIEELKKIDEENETLNKVENSSF